MSPLNDRKREQIVTAAAACFAKSGFDATRISDIAAAAGIGKGTVYEYFRAKEELLLEACLLVCRQKLERVQASLGGDKARALAAENPAKALMALVRTAILEVPAATQEHIRLFTDMWTVAKDRRPVLVKAQEGLRLYYQQWETMLDELYAAGVAKGVFRALPGLAQLPRFFTAVLDGLIWQFVFRPETDMNVLAQSGAELYLDLVQSRALLQAEHVR